MEQISRRKHVWQRSYFSWLKITPWQTKIHARNFQVSRFPKIYPTLTIHSLLTYVRNVSAVLWAVVYCLVPKDMTLIRHDRLPRVWNVHYVKNQKDEIFTLSGLRFWWYGSQKVGRYFVLTWEYWKRRYRIISPIAEYWRSVRDCGNVVRMGTHLRLWDI